MASSLKSVFCVPGLNERMLISKPKGVSRFCPSVKFSRPGEATSRACSVSIHAQATNCVSHALRWWEKTLKPNMIEIHSAQELVHSLLNAGDALVVVEFYSPGCGGCKALHPKICQIAELYPNAIFLQVNFSELKTMCHSLHIHVLPFFRFYRGSEGHVCSFSCTNATIKKFKDALAKHGNDRCSLGPAKGLDESELKTLASAGELSVNSPLLHPKLEKMEDLALKSHDCSGTWSNSSNIMDICRRLYADLLNFILQSWALLPEIEDYNGVRQLHSIFLFGFFL